MSKEYELTYEEVVAFSDSQAKTITQKNKRIVELEEVLKDARGVCHKAGLELMRDDIDEVLKGGDV